MMEVMRSAGAGPRTLLRVQRRFSASVTESVHPLEQYTSLDASNYNRIDERAVQRRSDVNKRFIVSAGRQTLLFLLCEPSATIEVDNDAFGATQRITSASINAINPGIAKPLVDVFENSMQRMHMQARVGCERDTDSAPRLSFEVAFAAIFDSGVLARAPTKRLNGLLFDAIGVMVPWLIDKLVEDFETFSEGIDERASFFSGELQEQLSGFLLRGESPPLPKHMREEEPQLQSVFGSNEQDADRADEHAANPSSLEAGHEA